MTPSVSVITPVYNSAATLELMLGSVLRQSLENIEHIVINDGSSDDSPAILDAYARDHPERAIVVIHQCNGGSAAAHDRGLQAARGEYVAFLDSDDYLEANFCEALYRQAVAEDAEICKGECIVHRQDCAAGLLEPTNASIRRVGSRLAFWNLFWTAIYKRQLLAAHHIGFDSKLALGEDHLFLNEAVLACRHLALCDGTAYHYCIRGGSLTHVRRGHHQITSLVDCCSRIAAGLCGTQGLAEPWGAAYALVKHIDELLVNVYLAQKAADEQRCLNCAREIVRQCPPPLQHMVRNMLYRKCPPPRSHPALYGALCVQLRDVLGHG